MYKQFICLLISFVTLNIVTGDAHAQIASTGIFEGHSDIGIVKYKGTVLYDSKNQQYDVTGSGADIWFDHDEFHYIWKRMKGDFILRTNAEFIGKGKELHRKFGWMVRKTLNSNSAHINLMVHGDGLTSMQFRKTAGDSTQERRLAINGADVIQLERRGKTYTMSVAHKGEVFSAEQKIDLDLGDDIYVGLFVCAHNADNIEKVRFNNVRIVVPAPIDLQVNKEYIGSSIEILDLTNQNSRVIYQSPKSLQAPNWLHDGKALIYNSEGVLYNFNLATARPAALNTGIARNNNNDHVLSFDGKMLAISSGDNGPSTGYTVPVAGGNAIRKTKTGIGASYMHGWSPDGRFLVFCGERNKEFDVYRIPAAGGPEVRLTSTPGLDDGPEYSPDGKYIYFNSVRSGLMQIWRMRPDGGEQVQITNDENNNWFPHISPDGKWIVYITFLKSEVDPGDHPFYKHVYLRLMPVGGGPSKVIAYLYGGQGTINTPSWSPDSKHIAFVSNSKLLFSEYTIGN